MSYSVGIVTYVKRFRSRFIPLLESIKAVRPDLEIIVCVNGEHNNPFDQQYRREMLSFLSQFDQVYPSFFTQFRSLAKLWNTCVWNSTHDQTLILNDDISVAPRFFEQFDHHCRLGELSFKINRSHSHFSVSRHVLDQIGWFDERFLGVGEEDGDFERRYEIHFGKRFESVEMEGITNLSELHDEQTLGGMRKVDTKYSLFNREFMLKKYDLNHMPALQLMPHINPCPVERFYWENRGQL